jgi:methylase of polypeptide subunit release factors
MNGLSIYSRRLPEGGALCLLADTPPHFNTRFRPLRVYAGADSYELMARVSAAEMIRGYAVEMGSGSGIQLISALKTHPAIVKAVGVERDRRAMHVSLFSAALNRAADRYVAVPDAEQLRQLVGGHEVTFGMSNPPFLALPPSVRIDEESRALLSDVSEIRETPEGGLVDVEQAFPQAGWGGQDGLEVTRQFIDVFRSVGARKILIYSQFAGDERAPSLIQKHVERIGEFEFAFEPVSDGGAMRKKPVQTAAESALTLARLLTATLLEKQKPQRLRLVVREGGPEHGLMKKIAAQIEASYRQLGISHFHDGFVHLVRRG